MKKKIITAVLILIIAVVVSVSIILLNHLKGDNIDSDISETVNIDNIHSNGGPHSPYLPGLTYYTYEGRPGIVPLNRFLADMQTYYCNYYYNKTRKDLPNELDSEEYKKKFEKYYGKDASKFQNNCDSSQKKDNEKYLFSALEQYGGKAIVEGFNSLIDQCNDIGVYVPKWNNIELADSININFSVNLVIDKATKINYSIEDTVDCGFTEIWLTYLDEEQNKKDIAKLISDRGFSFRKTKIVLEDGTVDAVITNQTFMSTYWVFFKYDTIACGVRYFEEEKIDYDWFNKLSFNVYDLNKD